MNKYFLVLSAICASIVAEAASPSHYDNPLLQEFFQKLDSVDYFVRKREEQIALKKLNPILTEPASAERYNAEIRVAESYFKFDGDSCVAYYNRALKTAQLIGDESLAIKARLNKANTLNHLGYLMESSEILSNIPYSKMDEPNMLLYYKVMFQLYYAMKSNSLDKGYYDKYGAISEAYRDSIQMYQPYGTDPYLRNQEKRLIYEGKYEEAYKVNELRLEKKQTKSQEALIMYDRFALATRYRGEPIEDWIDALLLSAIADLESANQDIASLLALEKYLLAIEEVGYAKLVSDYYFSTMKRYGSRFRRIHGFEHSMEINEHHTEMISRRQRELTISLVSISLLLLSAILLLIGLTKSQNNIRRLNVKLEKSNLASKRYVLGFFQLYSDYIERLLHFRARINTAIRRGNSDYVIEFTNPDKNIHEEELKQLYKNFDAAFLDIFPDYVVSFNALLKPEYRYETLQPGELNTELRIFALIKMGEKDSNTISRLLHYSIKTVYNKRSDIKRKLLVSNVDFEKKLAEI